jgi:heat shock protein HslJ
MVLRRIAAVLALGVLVAACSAGPGTGGQLEGTDWVLRSYQQDGALVVVPETQYADAEFRSQRVSGFAGCNTFDALYRAGGRMLLISQPAVTFMACADEANAFEAAYLAALQESRFYSERRGTLTVFDADGATILVFDAAPRNPVLGNWVVDAFATGDGTVTAPLDDTVLTAVFGLATVGGSSGCNTFTGTYGTNGTVLRIGRLATTRIACADDVMAQETAFLAAMEGAALVDRRGSTLTLTDRDGGVLVALSRPATDPDASPEPSATATPDATETSSPTPTATPEPTATPTAEPTPTPAPTASPTPAPTLEPPPSVPPAATCDLISPAGVSLGVISYPAAWSTLTEPAELACRYFDPEPITVPADPSTLVTAVTVADESIAYADAVAAATEPASWDITRQADVTISGLAATFVEAVSLSDDAGLAAGTSSFAYLIDLGSAGTVTIRTTGIADDASYAANSLVVTLIAATSTFTAPPG